MILRQLILSGGRLELRHGGVFAEDLACGRVVRLDCSDLRIDAPVDLRRHVAYRPAARAARQEVPRDGRRATGSGGNRNPPGWVERTSASAKSSAMIWPRLRIIPTRLQSITEQNLLSRVRSLDRPVLRLPYDRSRQAASHRADSALDKLEPVTRMMEVAASRRVKSCDASEPTSRSTGSSWMQSIRRRSTTSRDRRRRSIPRQGALVPVPVRMHASRRISARPFPSISSSATRSPKITGKNTDYGDRRSRWRRWRRSPRACSRSSRTRGRRMLEIERSGGLAALPRSEEAERGLLQDVRKARWWRRSWPRGHSPAASSTRRSAENGERAHQRRAEDQRHREAEPRGPGATCAVMNQARNGAEHEELAVGDVDDLHHPEHQRQPDRGQS